MKKDKPEVGPIYGVPLLDVLPMDGGGMKQALPNRQDLDDVRRTKINGNDRVVAGYEVLLEHYRRGQKEIERLNGAITNLAKLYLDSREGCTGIPEDAYEAVKEAML